MYYINILLIIFNIIIIIILYCIYCILYNTHKLYIYLPRL